MWPVRTFKKRPFPHAITSSDQGILQYDQNTLHGPRLPTARRHRARRRAQLRLRQHGRKGALRQPRLQAARPSLRRVLQPQDGQRLGRRPPWPLTGAQQVFIYPLRSRRTRCGYTSTRRARTVASISRRSAEHFLAFFSDSTARGTMVYPSLNDGHTSAGAHRSGLSREG